MLLPGAVFIWGNMKITLAMVTSLDGRSTNGAHDGPAEWASAEDQAVFRAQIAAHSCIVMGSGTYKASRSIIRPSAEKPRIVLTRRPQRFAAELQPGLSFSSDAPDVIVQKAKDHGIKSLLLVGGAETNARFLDLELVDEILVTIEPVLFGAGAVLTAALQKDIQLTLLSCKQLNERGTLLARYSIQKTKEN
jgi:dihydrofolate reductase